MNDRLRTKRAKKEERQRNESVVKVSEHTQTLPIYNRMREQTIEQYIQLIDFNKKKTLVLVFSCHEVSIND